MRDDLFHFSSEDDGLVGWLVTVGLIEMVVQCVLVHSQVYSKPSQQFNLKSSDEPLCVIVAQGGTSLKLKLKTIIS